MAVIYTFHASASPNQGVAWGSGTLGKQSGNSVPVADGAAGSAVTVSGFYRIVATSYCYVKIAADATNGANGEYWPADTREIRLLEVGDKIGVSAYP